VALTFVLGSYFAAEYARAKRSRRRGAAQASAPPAVVEERERELAGRR
jgi:hypothetical protein